MSRLLFVALREYIPLQQGLRHRSAHHRYRPVSVTYYPTKQRLRLLWGFCHAIFKRRVTYYPTKQGLRHEQLEILWRQSASVTYYPTKQGLRPSFCINKLL